MKNAAAYIRVSTDEQLEFSPDAQKRAIKEYAKCNNIEIKEEHIFVDEGISGRKAEKRPAFMAMISAAKQKPRPFEMILVHKFDRFARSREDSVVYKSLLRKEYGIKVISITEHIENDKFSIILESMLEAMAEYYSLNLSDEVKKGMFEKARRGEHIGKPPFGYDLINKNLVINNSEEETVRKIFDLFLSHNKSLTYISRYLNDNGITTKNGGLWRNCTIKCLLENPVYAGLTRYNYISSNKTSPNPENEWIISNGSHTPIVSVEEHLSAVKKLDSNASPVGEKAKNISSWLYRLVYCNKCGFPLILHKYNKGKYSAFECTHCLKDDKDFQKTISSKKIEKLILETVKNDLKIPDTIKINCMPAVKSENQIADNLKKQLENISRKKILAEKAYFSNVDSLEEYSRNKNLILKEEDIIYKKLEELKINCQKHSLPSPLNLYSILSAASIPIEERNCLAKQFISKILLDMENGTIQIYYYI